MALIFCEGFEDSRTVASNVVSNLPDIWTYVTGSQGTSAFSATASARSGYAGSSLVSNATTTPKLRFLMGQFGNATNKSIFVGFGVINLLSIAATRGTTNPSRFVTILDDTGAEVLQISVKKETQGDTEMRLIVERAGVQFAEYVLTNVTVTAAGTGTTAYYNLASWTYFEFKIDLVNNVFGLRANGIPKPVNGTVNSDVTYTPAITAISAIQIHGSANTAANMSIDDFYVVDSTGSSPMNTFLGPSRVLMPNYGTTALAAADMWSSSWNSNLTSNDGDTTYVGAGTTGSRQMITLNTTQVGNNAAYAVAGDEFIAAVQLNTVLRKTNLDNYVRPVYKSGTTTYTYFGAARTINNLDYASNIFIAEKNPVTSSTWAAADVQDTEDVINRSFGLEIVAGS